MYFLLIVTLGLCAIGFPIAFVVVAFTENPIITSILFPIFCWGAYKVYRKFKLSKQAAAAARQARIDGILSRLNSEHGANFEFSNGFGEYARILFDDQSKKYALLELTKLKEKVTRIGPLDDLREWQQKWTEQPSSDGRHLYFNDNRIEFKTADINFPLFAVYTGSKDAADTWNAKLGIILG